MAWIGPVIAAGASLIGGAMNSKSSAQANSANQSINRETRDWMTEMSNTAEQRHVKDLQSAGLNPALAYQTAAPVPGSPGQLPMQSVQSGQGMVNSAAALSQVSMQSAQIQKTRADAANVEADTAQKLATLPYTGATAKQSLSNLEQTEREINMRANVLKSQFEVNTQNWMALQKDREFQDAMLSLKQQIQEVDVQRARLGLPRLENDAGWQKAHPELAPWISSGAADLLLNGASKIGGFVK